MLDIDAEILLVEIKANDELLAQRALKKDSLVNEIDGVGTKALEPLLGTRSYFRRRSEYHRVVLLDLKLSLVVGVEVPSRVRSYPQTRIVPEAIIASSDEEREAVETHTPALNRSIAKPRDFEQFNEVAKHHWLLVNRQPPCLNELPAETISGPMSV